VLPAAHAHRSLRLSRTCRTRERQLKQEELDRTRKLGVGGADVDDVLTWVSRSRQNETKRAAEAVAAMAKRRAGEAEAAKRPDEEDSEDDEVRGVRF
jgi:hypothetical protein